MSRPAIMLLSLFGFSCHPVKHLVVRDDPQSNQNNKSQETAQTGNASGSQPNPVPVDVGQTTERTSVETSQGPVLNLPAVPSGCSGTSPTGADDYMLFQGETLPASINNVINLGQAWKANEVWDNGRLLVETIGSGSAISFSNEGIYHGFKFTPPEVNGTRKKFTLTGADLYVELKRSNPAAALPTFGLRVIKPGEDESNGGADTTTWMMDKPVSGSRFITAQTDCSLISIAMPQTFVDQKAVGNRLIWEMQSNWNPTDKIVIRKIVLKKFRFVP